MIQKKRVSSKTIFTATYKKAKYLGDHPPIKGTTGVYYFSIPQGALLYRPDSKDDTKMDWYRTWKENIQELD